MVKDKVVIVTMNGLVAIPHATEYVAAKHAVIGATRGASSETRETACG